MRIAPTITPVLIALATLLATPGCADSEPEQTSDVVVDTYTVRGRIVSVPSPDNPGGDLMVHHEAIPDFRGEGGTRGMNEMVMPFPVSDDLDLVGFDAGDAVSLTFTVDFNEAEDRLITYRATSIEALPEGTTLDLASEDGADAPPPEPDEN